MTRRDVSPDRWDGAHRANATAKAHRAMIAITALIDRLVGDPEVPEVTDRRSGYRWMSQQLIAADNPAVWQMVGIAHDFINGRRPRTIDEITDFRTSREILFPLLANAAEQDDRARSITDPFAGLDGGPLP